MLGSSMFFCEIGDLVKAQAVVVSRSQRAVLTVTENGTVRCKHQDAASSREKKTARKSTESEIVNDTKVNWSFVEVLSGSWRDSAVEEEG